MDNDPEFVNVSIRIKPAINTENTTSCVQIISKEPPVLLSLDRCQTFTFDHIFTEEVDQESIYNETVKPLVDYVKQGYNCTVFAYGQTGTGKTYTIGTDSRVQNESDFGLIPRTLNQFFEYNNDDDSEVEISLSFIEIYNEKVFDLLQDYNKPPLRVKGLKAQGCQERVYNSYEARHFLKVGNKNRHTAGTKQNAHSSRSHAIFTIYCNVRHKNHETMAKLNLVDLAGCESVKRTGNQGSTFHEGVNINKGLLSIGQVMTALSGNSAFIPYRQSVITSILQDSLNKQNFISLIACISPLTEDAKETSQTLEFAQRVKKMKNKPEVNEVVTRYRRDHPNLFATPRPSGTPFKRHTSTTQTPRPSKMLKPLMLGTINEPHSFTPEHNYSEPLSLNCISSVSSSVASALSNTNITQQTLSPVIKKYMTAMESSLMDRLEVVIKSTLKRPSRESRLAKQTGKEDVTGTPRMNWDKIQSEVSKLVRTEIAHLTDKNTRATSSPIDNIRKVLNYGSPFEDCIKVKSKSDSHDEEKLEFKVPELPVERRNKAKNQRTPSLSPIESIKVRRSMRLSLKRSNNDSQQLNVSDINCSIEKLEKLEIPLGNNNHEDSSEEFDYRKRRCSVRLNEKKRVEECKILQKSKSTKISRKLTVSATPAGKRLQKGYRQDSPCTAHTKKVLNILNTGSLKELETLHTVGIKTAQHIILFREMKGHLKSISDLSGTPGWGSKKFDKFVNENFLKKELI